MIHYHGTPFSGEAKNNTALAGHHAMVSYSSPDCLPVIAELCQTFCLDNGAFSAWKKGHEYDPEKVVGWIKEWQKHPGFDFAVVPDVIDGGPPENDALLDMVTLGDPLWCPVWHLHESLDRLDRLCHEWPRVAFGSSGQFAVIGNESWWGRMKEALDTVTCQNGYPITKLHGLRMLDPGITSYVPFSSADSTNVARNIGIDIRWTGPYVPRTQYTRALVIMDRIESHAVAARWAGRCWHNQNQDLFG